MLIAVHAKCGELAPIILRGGLHLLLACIASDGMAAGSLTRRYSTQSAGVT